MQAFCVKDYHHGDGGTYQTKIVHGKGRRCEERIDVDGVYWARKPPSIEEIVNHGAQLDCGNCKHRLQCLSDPDAYVTYKARDTDCDTQV